MCGLKDVPNLTPLVRLEELELSGNQLGVVRPGSFQGLVSLRKLWLMHSLGGSRRTVPDNSTCCARCHAPPGTKGRYIGDLDQRDFTCYAPVIVEPPTDLNVTEGMAAELKCRTGTSMTSVNWLTPNGTLMTHGAYKPLTLATDIATSQPLLWKLFEPGQEVHDSARQFVNETFISFPGPTAASASPGPSGTALSSLPPHVTHAPDRPFTVSITDVANLSGLEDVMKTTKIIIGCFVAITFMAAVMLVVFYKLRKQHQLHKHHGPARAIEIINVEDEMGPAGGASGIAGGSTVHAGAGTGGAGQSLRIHDPEIVTLPNIGRAEHINHYYKPHHFNNNVLGLTGGQTGGILNNKTSPTSKKLASMNMTTTASSDSSNPGSTSPPLPIPIPMAMAFHGTLKSLSHTPSTQTEPLLLSNGSKESVQETQI
ncbi:hypothetical protein MHYP_G00019200 [Metynnis hypsauchen]